MNRKATEPKPVKRVNHESPAEKVKQYTERLDVFYKIVEAWAKSWAKDARIKRTRTEITEKPPGTYPADILEIELPNLRPVRLRPAGCFVIGAEGRVEVESALGHETLVYLSEGGPAMTVQITAAAGPERPRTRSLRKETAPGWVWVQNRLMGLYPTRNDDLMHRMVEVLGRGAIH